MQKPHERQKIHRERIVLTVPPDQTASVVFPYYSVIQGFFICASLNGENRGGGAATKLFLLHNNWAPVYSNEAVRRVHISVLYHKSIEKG